MRYNRIMVTKPSAMEASQALENRGETVTLKQVAAEARVSLGVASTVLSGGSNNIRVAPTTQSRVLEAAQTLGYRSRRSSVPSSNPIAKNGKTDQSSTAETNSRILPSISVGIIASFNPITDPETGTANYDPWEHDITAGFEIALNDGASQVVTHYCNRGRRSHLPLPIEEALSQVLALGVDAVALIEISSDPQVVGRSLPALIGSGRPFVVVSTDALTAPVANVYFDSVNAGYQAARHLIEQGYREICFLAPVKTAWADERIEGAREALVNAGISPNCLTVFPPEHQRQALPSFDARVAKWDHMASGLESGDRLLAQPGPAPLAIIAANDATALGFLAAADKLGLRPGIDYALMGFDDAPQARENSLTTVRPPREGMGREAARLLLRSAGGDETGKHQIRLNSHLMARRSTPPRAALTSTSSLLSRLSSTLGSSPAR